MFSEQTADSLHICSASDSLHRFTHATLSISHTSFFWPCLLKVVKVQSVGETWGDIEDSPLFFEGVPLKSCGPGWMCAEHGDGTEASARKVVSHPSPLRVPDWLPPVSLLLLPCSFCAVTFVVVLELQKQTPLTSWPSPSVDDILPQSTRRMQAGSTPTSAW